MAKQTINIGTAANDGTGDPIRTAFGKVNDNFTEIYTANTGVNTGDQNLAAYATTAAVAAGYQPLDSDLTAIAALTTTAYGRALLSTTDAPTLRTAIGLGQTDAPTFGRLISSAAAPGGITVINSNGSIGGFILSAGAPGVINAGFAIYDNTLLVNRLYISASGNVGIGNTSTIEKLDVTGTIRASAGYHSINNYTDASNYDRGVFTFVSNALRIGTENIGAAYPSARPIDFVTGGVVQMSITAAGNVGIGTTSATSRLQVYLNPANTYTTETVKFGNIHFGNGTGDYSNIWIGSIATPLTLSASNYTLANNGTNTIINGGSGGLFFHVSASAKWNIPSSGHFLASSDGVHDIGLVNTQRPRNVYVGTSVGVGVGGWIKVTPVAVSALPSAATAGVGARSFVNDALTPVFGSAVVGLGSVTVPVYSTGSAWNVG